MQTQNQAQHIRNSADLHRDGTWGHLASKVHSHHALHVRLHDRNHGEALLLLLLLLLHGYHACRNTQTLLSHTVDMVKIFYM